MDSIQTNPFLRVLYDDACLSDLERIKTKFFEYLFVHHIFTEHSWSVASQQSPDMSSDQFVDLVVEKLNTDRTRSAVLFMEAKQPYVGPAKAGEVEAQAITAGQRYCSHSDKSSVWVITCVGPRVRLWVYTVDLDWLMPVYPTTTEMRQPSLYRDVLEYLKYIKKHPSPPGDLVAELARKFEEYNVEEGTQAWWHDPDDLMEAGEDTYIPAAEQLNDPYAISGSAIAGPSQQAQAQTQDLDMDQQEKPVKVSVRKVRHTMTPNEYLFETPKGKERSTSKDDWRQGDYKGKSAWFYGYKGVTYYTRSLG